MEKQNCRRMSFFPRKKKYKKLLLCTAALIFIQAAARAQQAQDISISFINDCAKISIQKGISPQTDAICSDMEALEPNYLAEITCRAPVKENERLPQIVSSLFLDLNLYKQIPYYSKQHDTTVPLFSKAELLESTATESGIKSTVLFCMTPFSEYTADLKIESAPDTFLFQHTNRDKIEYRGLTAIKGGMMRAGIAVYRDGDFWQIYALGGVKAVKPFFMKKRLEAAFNNRIKDFCVFYIEKLSEAESSGQ